MWITTLQQRPMPYEGPWLMNDAKYKQEVERTEALMEKVTYQIPAELEIPSPIFLVNDLQWIGNFKSETKSLEIDPIKFTEGLQKYKEWWRDNRSEKPLPVHLTTHVNDEIAWYTDLIWHAHLTDHVAYARDCARLFGKIFGHLPDGDDDDDGPHDI